MAEFYDIQDFVKKVRKIDDLDQLQRTFDEASQILGFSHQVQISLVEISAPAPRILKLDVRDDRISRQPPSHFTYCFSFGETTAHMDPAKIQRLYFIAAHFHHNIRRIKGLDPTPRLSPREKECLTYAARGLSDNDIADLLAISSTTVTGYMKNMRAKFKVRTRIQAVAIAVARGMITLP